MSNREKKINKNPHHLLIQIVYFYYNQESKAELAGN